MTGASFLLIALAVAVIGSLLVVSRNRPTRRHNDAMADFRREMEALAPPVEPGAPAPPTPHPFPGVAPIGRRPADTAPSDDRADAPAGDDQDPDARGTRPDAGSGAR